MRLKCGNGDRDEAVSANYDRAAAVFRARKEDFVATDQTHTVNVRYAGPDDAGKGIVRGKDYTDVDGLITNVPGLVLSAFFADCVPLYFVDMPHKAIGLSHSGWRGTVHRMGLETVKAMRERFGTDPKDLVCAIGPSICRDCYEVSEDVADAFRKEFPGHEKEILLNKPNGKYQLDLWKANEIVLCEAGVARENISVTDICTCCNPELLFSHRASGGKRGNLAAFLMLV